MLKKNIKRLAARLPDGLQQELKRFYFRGQLRRGEFATNEPEYVSLEQFVQSGDWVLDIGANIGHYACKLSRLVGPTGRVIAFEPVASTFELLVANSRRFAYPNTTVLNVAASDRPACVGLQMPKFDGGLTNYYRATITDAESKVTALAIRIDDLHLPGRVTLVKMDVEGHELAAIDGMKALILRDLPTMIIEASSEAIVPRMKLLGYDVTVMPESPNYLFRPSARP